MTGAGPRLEQDASARLRATNMQNLRLVIISTAFCFFLITNPTSALGQKYEVGAQFSGMHLHKIDEAPFGVGVRFNNQVLPLIETDVEWMHYPANPAGNFGETSFVAGMRIG